MTETVSKYILNSRRTFIELIPTFKSTKQEVPLATHRFTKKTSYSDSIYRQSIESTYQKVVAENRLIQFLDKNALLDLPVGIKTEVGGLAYVILIDSVILTPNGSLLFASMSFEAPGIGKLQFRGAGIPFSASGGIGAGRLELVGDYSFKLGANQLHILGSGQKTFVEFDCSGYQQLSLEASMTFSRNLIQPVDDQGKVLDQGQVSFDFFTTLVNWNDLLVAASIPPFQVNGLEGFTFSVTEAVLDLSDVQNAPNCTFPQGYQSPYLLSGNPTLWRGVFIKNLTISLPAQFHSKDDQGNTTRVSFSGTNMLIDDQGFSGIISASNLIPIDRGKIANWNFSLDQLDLALMSNTLVGAGFKGLINIPINAADPSGAVDAKKSLFGYTAVINPENSYLFTVTNPEQVNFNLWKTSEVKLAPSSYVQIELENNQFRAKAHLNGTMTITAGLNSDDGTPEADDKKNLKLSSIAFQDLNVQTVKPYVTIGYFSLGLPGSKLGGFPLSINKIEGGQQGDNIFLGVDLTLSLTGDEDGGGKFAAGGNLQLYSRAVETDDRLTYTYKELQINRFTIDIDNGAAFAFKGTLNFYKRDPIYGNGLSGTVDARFAENFRMQASAIFGTKDDLRYWYVDALVDLGETVPIFPAVFLSQFGGGASYHMQLDDQNVGSPLGATASGMVYIPSSSAGLGLKAMAGIKAGNEKVFNANATFEMAFRTGGGIKYMNFRGNAYLLSDPIPMSTDKLGQLSKELAKASGSNPAVNQDDRIAQQLLGSPEAQSASMVAAAYIMLDFDNHSLHACLATKINVAGGIMRGGGNAVLHFSQNEWYIYIGRPEYEKRFFMEFAGLVRSDSYFVMGSTVPDTPPPPAAVADIVGGINLDYMSDLNALADGAGIGFGASFSIDTGDKSFLIFYGQFQAGIGFDVMLKDYGATTCVGRGRIGIDGWYANGQAYAYFDGTIGVRVKVFKKKKNIEILSIGAAVIAQAKLPNPIWIRGVVGGHFSVLGGMVKGQCSFEIVIGEECQIENEGSEGYDALQGAEVVAQLTPSSGATEVDVFTYPQAVFNYELDKSYQGTGEANEPITFKIALDEFILTQSNRTLDAAIEWNDDHTVAVLKPSEILPPETTLTLLVTASFQERKNGTWSVATADGEALKETKRITFKTGKAPTNIPESNILSSYPSKDMVNFYKEESAQGYVRLNQGQGYLFEDPVYQHVARFTSNGTVLETPITYHESSKEVVFAPPADLSTGGIYEVKFVSVPKVQTNLEANITKSEKRLMLDGQDIAISTRSATGTVKNYDEHTLYENHFRCSQYRTFSEKIKSVNPSSGWRNPIQTGVHGIGSNFGGPEPFSYEEIYGINGEKPLITMEADLTEVTWYQKEIYPLLYQEYPLFGDIKLRQRNPEVLGLVPTKAVFLYQYPYKIYLTESSIQTGVVLFPSIVGRFDYYLAYFMFQDFKDLATQAINKLYQSGATNARLAALVSADFPTIRKGQYPIDITYSLPGSDQPITTYRHKIYNPVD